jgi:hypothetical protein
MGASNTSMHTVHPSFESSCAEVDSRSLKDRQDRPHADAIQIDAGLAAELVAAGVTTKPVETVAAVLGATRGGASINAAAKASNINCRTAQRIVQAAEQRRLTAAS